ncbi:MULTISPECIES: EbsA family protein [Streptococcus]|uniref:EbsA family protein n=1 Tax=Streptococcus TaxID=1301 RepID=UPI000379978A|nr:EbsA family protein [Streptococcus entericus]
MIKIFGKVRYHWQPELSLAIIYWSLAWLPTFFALSLIYEHSRATHLIFGGFWLTVILTIFGFHRYFTIGEDGYLGITSLNPFTKKKIPISAIEKVEISKYRVSLRLTDHQKKTVFMRKWPKKYFLDALAIHPAFNGEVELHDNLTRHDYFWAYRKDKKPSVKD